MTLFTHTIISASLEMRIRWAKLTTKKRIFFFATFLPFFFWFC